LLPEDPVARHRVVAGTFADRVRGVTDWDAPSPVRGWTARDVVGHLLDWYPPFLAAGSGHRIPEGPSVDEDPYAAWTTHADAVQALLDDPVVSASPFRHPRLPAQELAPAVDRFYTVDVFMHTWDLARATGQDDHLDEALCAQLLAGMEPIEDLMRGSGQYGPRVPVPDDAPVQDRLLGFIGRDPAWAPPGR
jgi:uncharacterized protein (TIGR03086 family)